MRTYIILLLSFVFSLAQAQDTPPSGLKSISNALYIAPDATIWLNKGTPYNWNRMPRFSDLSIYAPITSPTFLVSAVLPSNTSIGTISSTEIGYLDNVTSSIQTQLNNKLSLTGGTLTGQLNGTIGNFSSELSVDVGSGTAGNIRFKTAGLRTWNIFKSSAGDLAIARYNSGGTFVDNSLVMSNSTGDAVFLGSLTSNIAARATTATTFLTHTGGLLQYRTVAQVRADIGAGTGSGTVTSITPAYGFTSVTPITTTGTLTVDSASATGLVSKSRLTAYANSKAQAAALFVPLTRTLTAGYGIATIGDLSANRNVISDSTVLVSKPYLSTLNASLVHKAGVETITGIKTITSGLRIDTGLIYIKPLTIIPALPTGYNALNFGSDGLYYRMNNGAKILQFTVTSTAGSAAQFQDGVGIVAWTSQLPIAGSFSGVGTATTSFVVTIGITMPNTTYKVNITSTSLLGAAQCYVSAKTTTTFTVTYMTGLTGAISFDWILAP